VPLHKVVVLSVFVIHEDAELARRHKIKQNRAERLRVSIGCTSINFQKMKKTGGSPPGAMRKIVKNIICGRIQMPYLCPL
jgi:hypothetical protein